MSNLFLELKPGMRRSRRASAPTGRDSAAQGAEPWVEFHQMEKAPTGRDSKGRFANLRSRNLAPLGASCCTARCPGLRPGLSNLAPLGLPQGDCVAYRVSIRGTNLALIGARLSADFAHPRQSLGPRGSHRRIWMFVAANRVSERPGPTRRKWKPGNYFQKMETFFVDLETSGQKRLAELGGRGTIEEEESFTVRLPKRPGRSEAATAGGLPDERSAAH